MAIDIDAVNEADEVSGADKAIVVGDANDTAKATDADEANEAVQVDEVNKAVAANKADEADEADKAIVVDEARGTQKVNEAIKANKVNKAIVVATDETDEAIVIAEVAEANEAHVIIEEAEANSANKSNKMDKAIVLEKAIDALVNLGELFLITVVLILIYSLTKYSVIFTEVEGDFGKITINLELSRSLRRSKFGANCAPSKIDSTINLKKKLPFVTAIIAGRSKL